ncbi:MAG: hypothetical protein OHK0052_17370 [Anaerolineales bacterium]
MKPSPTSTGSQLWGVRPRERAVLLATGDLLVALISLAGALYFWAMGDRFLGLSVEFLQARVPFWFYLLPLGWLFLLIELYDIRNSGNWRMTVRGVLTAAALGLGLYLLLFFAFFEPPRSLLPRRGMTAFLLLVVVLTLVWRFVYVRIFTLPRLMRRVLVVGAGKSGEVILKVINSLWPPPFYVVGIVDDDPQKIGTALEGFVVLGGGDSLLQLIEQHHVSDILVAISGEMRGQLFQALLDAQEKGVEITRMPVMYEELLQRVPIQLLDAQWLLRSFVDESRVSAFYQLGKRLLDLLGGFVGLLILAVLLPFVAIATLLDSGFPIFYGQIRLGKGGKPYKILKFRTMRQDAEADGKPRWAKEDDDRATRVGKFLRKTHIDEVPQFWNVLTGEMSLVGPRSERPELVEMFQKHIPFYRARLLEKPGITGWAQVNFGYAANIEETIIKLEYDLYYIKHRNLWMDIIVLLRTPWTVFGLRGR